MTKFIRRLREFVNENILMLSGMLLMLASAGVDGLFLSMWMTKGFGWMGYVLNFVSDCSSYIMSNAYGDLQGNPDPEKRQRSKALLYGEFVNIVYSWMFSYLVLRERFVFIMARPIFAKYATLETELLAFVSAGFVPLSLVFLGYADSLNKRYVDDYRAQHTKDATAQQETQSATAQAPEMQAVDKPATHSAQHAQYDSKRAHLVALLSNGGAQLSNTELAEIVGCSRQYVSSVKSTHKRRK